MDRGGEPTLTLATRAHAGELTCLDLSACGARLASGGGDRALRLWAWSAGRGWGADAAAVRAHRYGVTAARWAAGGALVASGGVDGALRVWAARGGRLGCRRELAAPGAAAVRALCWVGGGRGARLAAGHDDGAARVWGVRRGVLLARVMADGGALHALAVLAGGALLLTGCTEGTLRVFDLVELCAGEEEPEEVAPLLSVDGAHDLGALCADAAPGGRQVATGGHDALVRLWSVAAGERALSAAGALAGHAAAVTALRWARGGVLASASLDRSARLWAAQAGACLHVVQAHARYLTCIALEPGLRYMITGSNDRSFRTWSLGGFSLAEELRAPCNALAHFALGDLEGIGPVEADEDAGEGAAARGGAGGARCVWRARAHSGSINCIAAHGDFLATASSDGTVKVWRWRAGGDALAEEHSLSAHRYPALACDFGAAGSVLLSAGLDGCAYLWDVQTGVQVRSLRAAGAGGEGGGGVRGARLSAQRPPRALLATDDGLAPLWSAAQPDPQPAHVYGGLAGAATCCAWSRDARLCAVGGAGGELRVLAPPHHRALHHDAHAHDLGVMSCDFTPPSGVIDLPEDVYLLATAGNDSLIKLWTIELGEEETGAPRVHVVLGRSMHAHGGAVLSVRWAVGWGAEEGEEGALLASAGDDRWARVWSVAAPGGEVVARARAAVCGSGAGGALSALATRSRLAVGMLDGQLALWRLAPAGDVREDDDAAPRFWREAGVARWLKDCVSRSSGARCEAALLRRARAERLTGARLLDAPAEEIVASLGYGAGEPGEEGEEGEEGAEGAAERLRVRASIEDELVWLRLLEEPPPADMGSAAPHALLCPLTHALLRWPTSAADGFTYERDNIHEWLLASSPEEAVSPMTGRRLRNTRLAPNHELRRAVREYRRQAAAAAAAAAAADTADTADTAHTADTADTARTEGQ